MSLYRNVLPLLTVNPAVNTAQTGPASSIIPEESGGTFKVFMDATQSGGATSPTVAVHIETSHDGVNWISLANVSLSADGSISDFKDLAKIGPKVRAKTILGGGTPPNHTATVKLASDKPFRLFP